MLKREVLFLVALTVCLPIANASTQISLKLKKLEHQYGTTVGLYALDTANGGAISYNADKRFPFQSTFKLIAVSALLYQDAKTPLLDKKVLVKKEDIVPWSPITVKYIGKKVSFSELARGAIAYSDNAGVNIIIRELGGLSKINQFAKLLSNYSFNLNHYESNLNSQPNDQSDSSTPKDMGQSVKTLLLGNVLTKVNKELLKKWHKDNTTGNYRIRAGVPISFTVADKTGSGGYGIANDIGMAWSPYCMPIVLAIYTNNDKPKVSGKDQLVADVTRAVIAEFKSHNQCFSKHNQS